MRLANLSELPEDPEPSSSLGACILRIIRLRLLTSLSGCALIQSKEFLKLFLLYEIGLCLAVLLMASENTAMQSYTCVSLQCYFICLFWNKIRQTQKQATESKASD